MSKIFLILRWLGDWVYAIYVTLRPSKQVPLEPVAEVPTAAAPVIPAATTVESPVVEATQVTQVVTEPTPTIEEVNADSKSE